MKFLITASLSFFGIIGYTQTTTVYYDDYWMATEPGKATYYADFVKSGNMYQCTSYWIAGNVLRGKSTYPDTLMANPFGLQVLYSKNGRIEDSIFYSGEKRLYVYHYYPNGQLAAHYYVPDNSDKAIIEGFDDDGKKIKNYVFEKEAEFKGGHKAWQAYIIKSVSKDLKIKGEGDIIAKVQIQFIVSKDGDVIAAKIYQSSGYSNVDKDALRVIKESPSWNGAIQFNKPVNAYRLQPFTYQIPGEKKEAADKKN